MVSTQITYQVTFKKMFDETGCGTDYPTDFLHTRIDCNPDFQDMIPPDTLPGEGIEIWKYEVEEKDAESFEAALNSCETVTSFEQLEQEEQRPAADITDFLDGAAHIHIGSGCLRVSNAQWDKSNPRDGLIFSNYHQAGMPDHSDTFVARDLRDDKTIVEEYLAAKGITDNFCFDEC